MISNYHQVESMKYDEMFDILRPLNDEEFSELLELYKEKYNSNGFQYLLLYTQFQWNSQLAKLNIDKDNQEWISFRKTFYTHRKGDFRKYGTYICLHHDLIQSVAFHTWEPNCTELLECLSKTNLIQWKNGPLLISVTNECSEAVKKIVISKGGSIQKARQCQGLILERDKALNIKVPSLAKGFKVIPLEEHHADLIHANWANNKEASLNYVKGFIHLKRCIGIMEESTNNLVGWIFQNEFSGLAILQVLPSAQRRGLGKYLALAMSHLIAKSLNVHSSAFVVVGNVKSESLLQKIGYERHVVYEWIQLDKIY
ncbi:uncharacterized protein LOC111688430 [Lucilia cuprina]|uniref:uncharacterized protein LOC111688430 n=1 Tax=Lucilia cuprina TaxID=7375 RepID=UPI001F05B901|nr:uncharacterized protein LOC111688430 [Lucilia cuprina]